MGGRLVMIAVPIGVVPFGRIARIGRLVGCLLTRRLSLRLSCQRLAKPALVDGGLAAAIPPLRGLRTPLWRHRRQSWVGPVARHRARLLIQRGYRWDRDVRGTIFRR